MIKLGEAVEILKERHAALGIQLRGPDAPSQPVGILGDPKSRLLLSGFDLDLSELEVAMCQLEIQTPRVMDEIASGAPGIASIWLDGLLTGLIAAKRERSSGEDNSEEQNAPRTGQ